MEKVTLVITSLNPNCFKLQRLLRSAKGFDNIILHIDADTKKSILEKCVNMQETINIGYYCCIRHLRIEEAYNAMIKQVNTEWVCCMCDDDYFEEGLAQMLSSIRSGVDCDVCTFQTYVTGFSPWRDKGSVLVEAINRISPLFAKKGIELKARRFYGYKKELTPEGIAYQSNIPAGAFFRKEAWEKVGGFSGSIAHDWILWLKMARAGVRFKYFPHIVYTYERRENSAWFRQFRDIAGGSMEKLRRIVSEEARVQD